jgi:hypothetical protein
MRNLSTRKINSYRRSLKLFMGYCRESNWAMEFHTPVWEVLGELLLNQQGTLDHFLTRYPRGGVKS